MTGRPFTAGQLAALIGAVCEGDADRVLTGVSTLQRATRVDLAFCSGGRWRRVLHTTQAGAVVVDEGDVPTGVVALRHARPRFAYAQAARALFPVDWPEPGIDPRAAVHDTAVVDPTATIEAFAVVAAGAIVGPGSWVQSHAYVGPHARIGRRTRLFPTAVLMDRCVLGDRVRLQPGAVVGGDGFGYAVGPDGLAPVPQLGIAIIENDVDVGVNSCVDRAALDETVIGQGTRLDNLVQIAHGVRTGASCLLAAFAAVSGGSKLGDRVIMAGRTAITEHVTVGDDAVFVGMTATSRDVDPGARIGGSPARPYGQWAREQVAIRRLPAALRTLDGLATKVRELAEQSRTSPKEG